MMFVLFELFCSQDADGALIFLCYPLNVVDPVRRPKLCQCQWDGFRRFLRHENLVTVDTVFHFCDTTFTCFHLLPS